LGLIEDLFEEWLFRVVRKAEKFFKRCANYFTDKKNKA